METEDQLIGCSSRDNGSCYNTKRHKQFENVMLSGLQDLAWEGKDEEKGLIS